MRGSLRAQSYVLVFVPLLFMLAMLLATLVAQALPGLSVIWPAHIEVAASSAQNFSRHNQGTVGTILVSLKCDETMTPLIPPTPDIDTDLRASLSKFLGAVTFTAGAGCVSKTFAVRFDVQSGVVTETELPPPSNS